MNRSAFCSYFKRCKKMTFSQFVTQYRLNTACELLKHSQKQVSEICFAVGFNDVPHFNRVFKELQGMTPKEYRKRNIWFTLPPPLKLVFPYHIEFPFLHENHLSTTHQRHPWTSLKRLWFESDTSLIPKYIEYSTDNVRVLS